MSAKKKATRKSSKSKARASKKKKSTAKKPTRKKQTARKKLPRKKATRKRRAAAASRPPRRPVSRPGLGAGTAGQSGDLQGLSRRERSDSESVEELLEEGNAFEAGIVKGIEDAPFADEDEIRTHEVPVDDVPEEYLDEDHNKG